MRVAGFGLRASATLATLEGLLAQVPGAGLLAAPADKADHPALQALARAAGLSVCAIAPQVLVAQPAQTLSPRQPARYGTKSVAEAAALAAAGPGARLIMARIVAADGRATVAIAEGTGA